MKFLDGIKSYLGMIGLGILGICWVQGWISDDVAKVVGTVLGTWTGVGFAHKGNKIIAGLKK